MRCRLLLNGICMDMMGLELHVGDVSSMEAMEFLTMNPAPERCLPDQKRVKQVPSS